MGADFAAPAGKKALGRPRVVPLRGVIDARDFPKRSTVQRYIYAWQAKGLLEKVNFLLVEQARERGGSKASPPSRHPGSRRRWLRSATYSHGCAKSPAFASAGFCRWCLRAGNKLGTALAGRGQWTLVKRSDQAQGF